MSDPAPHPRRANTPAERIEPTLPMPAGMAGMPREQRTPVPYSPPLAARPPSGDLPLSWEAAEIGARVRAVPILGGLAVIFGIGALFKAPLVLGPLAMAFGLAALCRRQVSLGAIGGIAGLVGLLISPLFWTLVGLGWVGAWLWAWFLG